MSTMVKWGIGFQPLTRPGVKPDEKMSIGFERNMGDIQIPAC